MATGENAHGMIRLDRNHGLGPFDPSPEGRARVFLKVVEESAGAHLWPVPPEGFWVNPAGAPFDRVGGLESMKDPIVVRWVARNPRPGTLVLVSFAPGMEAGQVEEAPVLETLVDSTLASPEETKIREAATRLPQLGPDLDTRPGETPGQRPIRRPGLVASTRSGRPVPRLTWP
jgi:hypothetical protein